MCDIIDLSLNVGEPCTVKVVCTIRLERRLCFVGVYSKSFKRLSIAQLPQPNKQGKEQEKNQIKIQIKVIFRLQKSDQIYAQFQFIMPAIEQNFIFINKVFQKEDFVQGY
eukprot:TRINITY_DN84785_c0_g1_i1.p2 TRINITY_DN84785_c0_g1~~TRINITY_DN84785_c0_g1_i1.p2  ORF type:complete len:110 (-),score=4.25 TRINITY_DN84785_c0_g1_i1:197-526(-)